MQTRKTLHSVKSRRDPVPGPRLVARGDAIRMAPDQINVCMFTPASSGGHARYTHELLTALSGVGQDQNVRASLITNQDLARQYRTALYDIHDILPPLRPREKFRNTLHWASSRAAHYIKCEEILLRWVRQNADGVHYQGYTPWLIPRHFRLLKSWGKLTFLSIHNIYPHTYYPLVPRSLQHSWDKAAMLRYDALLVHTEDLKESLIDFLGKRHPPIFVTPHGVWDATAGADALPADKKRIGKRRLLFFGVIRPNKGLHVLLRAMKRLPDCTLVVAGESEDARYQKQVRTLMDQLPAGRMEYIDRFIGDDEIPDLFLGSSVVVLPYTSFSAQSGVLHDALAYGLPVVATDVGALGESVRRWGIGRVVPTDDDEALAGAIRELLKPQSYQEASQAAVRVREDFSWARTAEATIEAYRSIWERLSHRG